MTPFLQLGDMMELKVVHKPTDTLVDEEAETVSESKGPEGMLDFSESLVDDAHQTM